MLALICHLEAINFAALARTSATVYFGSKM